MKVVPVVLEVREASRRLVRELGFMQPTLAGTELSPSSVHALIEIGRARRLGASELTELLKLEKSSVSRLVARLVAHGEIAAQASREDSRAKLLSLTKQGRATLASIERFANRQVADALDRVPDPAGVRDALTAYARALAGERSDVTVDIVPGYRTGIIGHCASLHAEYYAPAFGFGAVFEQQVASGFAEFAGRLDNPVNGVWSAVSGGEIVGTVAIDGEDMGPDVAHLRWFIVGDGVRGLGVGRKLLAAALAHCDQLGRETRLWTFRGLDSARHLYEACGFRLAQEAPGSQWGTEVIEQLFVRAKPTAG